MKEEKERMKDEGMKEDDVNESLNNITWVRGESFHEESAAK